jgi:hypothetical protein
MQSPIIYFPKINYESYVSNLTDDIMSLDEKNMENTNPINICISGGGMAAIYGSGILFVILSLYQKKQIQINHIYGTSAGAFSAFMFLLVMNTPINVSDFLYMVNNDLRNIYKRRKYIIDSWIELIETIIPPDFYKVCNDKLFITIHTIENYSIKHRNIHRYESNEHLINTLKCSGTIPYLTTSSCFTLYKNHKKNITNTNENHSNSSSSHYAFDGLFPVIVDNTYKTLYINLVRYKYPLLHRIYFMEKIYDSLMLDGLYDIYHFLKKGEPSRSLYYYHKKQNKKKNVLIYNLSLQSLIGMFVYWYILPTYNR